MDNWKDIAERAISLLESCKKLAAIFAPTGFGKTMATPHILEKAKNCGLASRVVHVVPTRSLLRQIYTEKFRNVKNFDVAYQSLDRIPRGLKSPYFLADIVVTTLESFLLNVYKFPPSELTRVLERVSEGHYYPSFAALSSSVVVLDEAHLYMGDSEGEDTHALAASAVAALSEMRIPVIVETATMPTCLLEEVVDKAGIDRSDVGVVYVCPDSGRGVCPQVNELRNAGFQVDVVSAGHFGSGLSWTTRFVNSLDEAVNEAGRLCRDRLVLFVSNTVCRAINVYKKLQGICEAVLLHAKLSEKDKEDAYTKLTNLRDMCRGVIVASPVIEVGVEVDAEVLITEPAPMENLAQRAGRLCRKSGNCRGEVVIVNDTSLSSPYDDSLAKAALNEMRSGLDIEWRLLWNSASGVTYVKLLENISQNHRGKYRVAVYEIFKDMVISDSRPLDIAPELAHKFKGFSLVKVYVGDEPKSMKDLEDDHVVLDLSYLRQLMNQECLKTVSVDGVSKVVTMLLTGSGKVKIVDCESEVLAEAIESKQYRPELIKGLKRELAECASKLGLDYMIDYYVKSKPCCYEKGVGWPCQGSTQCV
ncbi:MAG: CRISPR-associated helicase Cas3' [Sulfolobales archaeon]|nr:CRISPR-associated helicase Cas3' [Sulfolobales archaeon]